MKRTPFESQPTSSQGVVPKPRGAVDSTVCPRDGFAPQPSGDGEARRAMRRSRRRRAGGRTPSGPCATPGSRGCRSRRAESMLIPSLTGDGQRSGCEDERGPCDSTCVHESCRLAARWRSCVASGARRSFRAAAASSTGCYPSTRRPPRAWRRAGVGGGVGGERAASGPCRGCRSARCRCRRRWCRGRGRRARRGRCGRRERAGSCAPGRSPGRTRRPRRCPA